MRGAVPGRIIPLAFLSSLVWLRRGCLLKARLVLREANPITDSKNGEQEAFFTSRLCLVNIRCQDQNFMLTEGRLSSLAGSLSQ